MASIRQVFESLNYSSVATIFVSGNVVFEAQAQSNRALEIQIEERLRETLGLEIATFIRTDAELAAIAANKPFAQSEIDAAGEFNIIFLGETLVEESRPKLMALARDENVFHIHGREIYWLRRKKLEKTTFSTVPLVKVIRHPFTIRTSKIVTKIALKYCFVI